MRDSRFGLVVIGNEVLDGRRNDAHFGAIQAILGEHGSELAWSLMLPDDTVVLTAQLRWAFARPEPFFSCGGIGGTPDDLTRGCAAAALGVGTELHAEGLAMLRPRFGGDLTEARCRMVDFPAGSSLIPNPVNNVPGFSIAHGYFVPGFPSMAHPMVRWVLDELFPRGEPKARASLELSRAKEADLVYIMEQFILTHPALGFSSLPRFARGGAVVELGLSGRPADVEAGILDLKRRLDEEGVAWRDVSGQAPSVQG